jgi:hypothetical protein
VNNELERIQEECLEGLKETTKILKTFQFLPGSGCERGTFRIRSMSAPFGFVTIIIEAVRFKENLCLSVLVTKDVISMTHTIGALSVPLPSAVTLIRTSYLHYIFCLYSEMH